MALINIASDKQLFADNYLIESLKDARQVMNPAQKLESNPVLWPEKPWEGDYLGVSNVWFDHADQIFKMWYRPATHRAYLDADGKLAADAPADDDPITACLALSEDGIQWERPELGLVEYQGSKKNNLLPDDAFMPYFFEDMHEEDPSKRYKGLVRTGSTTTTMTFDLYYSPDSLTWTPCEHNPVIDTAPRVGRWGPTNFMGWDPIRLVYAVHMENCLHRRCPHAKRLIGRAESPDMIHWSDPETILMPDEQDPPDTEFYTMPVTVYAGLYVGLLWIFRTNDSTHHPELVFSRNGIHYERNYREPFIQRGGHKGMFDSSCVYNLAPLVHDDRIYTYYTGSNWRSYQTLLELGDRGVGAIGIATTPLDGFVAVEGGKRGYSEMVTRAFGFSGRQLRLNLQAHLADDVLPNECEVRVALLTPNHEPLSGFGFEDADPITTTNQAHVVSWQGKSDLSDLGGGPIKLHFYFKNAKLFAFQFVDPSE